MRILFLCHKTPYPPNDGGVIATLNMIQGMANAGNVVEVLSMKTPKHDFDISNLPEEITKEIKWHQVDVNTNICVLPALFNLIFSDKPYNAVRFNSKAFSKKLASILENNKFDVIQLEGLYLSPYINVLRKFSQVKVSLRSHNVEAQIWERLAQNETNIIKKFYLKVLAKRVANLESSTIKKVDFVIPITQVDAKNLSIYGQANVHVSSTGIDSSQIAPKVFVNNTKTICYIGALDWVPNQEGVLWFINNVWSPLKVKFPDWNFVIAGRKAPDSFVAQLKKLPVKYIGQVKSAHEFLAEYNIMAVPLLSGSGMRIKIIEGMALGKCIVTTSIGAEGIKATNNSNIFISDKPSEQINVFIKLIENQELIVHCGENALEFIKKEYNNDVIIGKLNQFYKAKFA